MLSPLRDKRRNSIRPFVVQGQLFASTTVFRDHSEGATELWKEAVPTSLRQQTRRLWWRHVDVDGALLGGGSRRQTKLRWRHQGHRQAQQRQVRVTVIFFYLTKVLMFSCWVFLFKLTEIERSCSVQVRHVPHSSTSWLQICLSNNRHSSNIMRSFMSGRST